MQLQQHARTWSAVALELRDPEDLLHWDLAPLEELVGERLEGVCARVHACMHGSGE